MLSRVLTAGAAVFLWAGAARADLLTLWAAAKTDYVSGSGDIWSKYDSSMGYGAGAGLEVVGIDLWGDALLMGSEQGLFTANLGFDLSFGDEVRFTVGGFTGPMFFWLPKEEPKPLAIEGAPRTTLNEAGFTDAELSSFENKYNEFAETESTASQFAVGWNVARLQVSVEYKVVPFIYVGAGGEFGYHFILSGEDAAADQKAGLVDDLVKDEPGLSNNPEAEAALRDAVGAEETDPDNLDGTNYQLGIFVRFEL